MKFIRPFLILAAALTAVFMPLAGQAATYTWTGAGFFGNLDYLWSNPNNWAELSAPQAGEQDVQIVFPNTAAPRSTTNDVLNLVVQSVVFQGANYAVHGPAANGITMTLRGPLAGGPFTLLATANGCQFGSGTRLHLGSTGTVAVASGTQLTLKSRVSGVYGFMKTGPGTLSFQGVQANTFTGPVTVQHGVIDFRGVGTSMPGSLIVGDGNPGLSPIARLYLNDQIGDASPVMVEDNGVLELDGHNDTIGALTLAGGTVTTIQGIVAGTLTLNGNVTNHLGRSGNPSTIAGKLSLGSSTRGFQVDGGSELVINASISGATAGLTKAGPGQLTLTASGNTYFGATTVQAGTLALVGAATPGSIDTGTVVAYGARLRLLGAAVGNEALSLSGYPDSTVVAFGGTNSWDGAITVAGDCALDIDPAAGSDHRLTLGGIISGPGAMRLIGWGHLHFTGFGGNTFSGGFYGDNGLTHFEKSASAPALGGPLFVGRLEDPFPHAHVIVGALNQIPNHLPVTVRTSGALTADANDTLGPVIIEGGAVFSMAGSFTLSSGVTNRLDSTDLTGFHGETFLTAGDHVFHNEFLSKLNVHGALLGAGGVTLQGGGMVVYYNTNSYAGPTHVADGTLRLVNRGRPGSSAAGTVVDGLASLQLFGVGVTNETLQLEPRSGYVPRVSVFSTNIWKGPVILNADARIDTFSLSHLEFDGPVSGPAGILYEGDRYNDLDGVLVLSGGADNTFAGDVTVLEGSLILNKLNAVAVPGNLIVGHGTNGAPAATVSCYRPGQFAIPSVSTLNDRHVTVNPSGSLRCGGYDQSLANLRTTGGSVFTEGGTVSLGGGWVVHPDSSPTYCFGNVRLASPYLNHTHHFDVETNASLLLFGDVSEGGSTAGVWKQGKGELAMVSSNSFNGTFTIDEGRVIATGARPFGTVNGGTHVGYNGTLLVYSSTNAEPFSLAGSGYTNQGVLHVRGQSQFTGPIFLGYNADIVTPADTNLIVFTGAITGPGGLTKRGEGRLVLAGSDGNTFSGATRVKGGQLELAKTNVNAISGALEIAVGDGDALVRYLRPDQLSDLTPVTIGANGQFRLLGHSDTIGSLSGFGLVELLAGSLLTGNDQTETTYGGVINGLGGKLTKVGTNTFTLTGDNTYTGSTLVKGGTLLVRGQQPQSEVVIQTGGTLGGIGAVGPISDLSGHVKPGLASYGTLKCGGFVTHAPGNVFQVEINGAVPGVNCDQLDVKGGVTLMGGTLQVAMNFAGAVGNEYVVVKNDGADAVTGTFIGLPQNGMLTNNGVAFQISYTGGDGNDVVLVQKSVRTGPQIGRVARLDDGTIRLLVEGEPNALYYVEATENLTPPAVWTEIGQTTANATGQVTFDDPDAPQHAMRFYRFRLP